MSKKIFFKHRIDGKLKDAYSVRLRSEDGTYGVKALDDGNVVVHPTGVIESSEEGIYEYEFSHPSNVMYVASWEIISEEGDDVRYVVKQVGPFDENGDIIAVSDSRGKFIQGDVTSLILNITEFDGTPVNPERISLLVTDEDQNVILEGTPEKIKDGTYIYDWAISTKDHHPGTYIATWTYGINGISKIETYNVVVAERTGNAGNYSGKILLMRQALDVMLDRAQHIPVYFQQAHPSYNNRIYSWTKPRWNQKSGTRIYRNKEVVTSGYEIDYSGGKVIFDNKLTSYDVVHADYNFRWFSDEMLDRFLSNGLHRLNVQGPHSSYSINNLPEKYIPTVLYGALVDALRSLLLAVNFEEPAQFFGGPEEASRRFSQIETLKKNYEDDLVKMLEQKKLQPYVGLTKVISTPSYTLPGGRSRWFRMIFSK